MSIETTGAALHAANTGQPFWVMGDRVVLRGKLAGTPLNVVDVTIPPGSGTPPHSHASPEIFRILDGTVTIWTKVNGEPREFEAVAGDVVTIPAHAPHGYRNAGKRPVMLMAIVDDQMVHFFEQAASGEAPSGPPSHEAIEQIMRLTAKHGITLLEAA